MKVKVTVFTNWASIMQDYLTWLFQSHISVIKSQRSLLSILSLETVNLKNGDGSPWIHQFYVFPRENVNELARSGPVGPGFQSGTSATTAQTKRKARSAGRVGEALTREGWAMLSPGR